MDEKDIEGAVPPVSVCGAWQSRAAERSLASCGKQRQNMTKDLTVGSPTKLIIQFTLPLLLGMLFQQFYNLVDTVIVGKFVGVDALAGVGAKWISASRPVSRRFISSG